LVTPEVGSWAEDKYRLLALYDELFSSGMKQKWDARVYIDLYSGAGHSHIRGTKTFLKGSPLIALTLSNPFDKYIFCEESADCLASLKERVERIRPLADVEYVAGRCDAKIGEIIGHLPKGSSRNKVLSLCVVDPFDFGIKFDTLRQLSTCFVDFVVLLAIGMDANRNYEHYVRDDSPKIDEALGNREWRNRWEATGSRRKDFRRFLANEFCRSMESLKYLPESRDLMKLVRSTEKNLPLYHMVLFSRHPLAFQFWNQVLKYSTDQRSLWD
jgi:three-Cys-motif partner protein